jgi:hypothetical protein
MTTKRKPKQQKPQSKLAILVQRYEQGQWLVQRLRSGENVELREIKAVMGNDVAERFKNYWEGQKANDEYTHDKPEAVSNYEQMLRKADMLFGRAEKLAATKDQRIAAGKVVKADGIKRMYKSAETQYERALEQLEVDCQRDRTLEDLFDRELKFGVAGNLSPSRHGVPRYKYSRSLAGDRATSSKTIWDAEAEVEAEPEFASNKARMKCAAIEEELERLGKTYSALENTLAAIDEAEREEAERNKQRLKEALAKLKKGR